MYEESVLTKLTIPEGETGSDEGRPLKQTSKSSNRKGQRETKLRYHSELQLINTKNLKDTTKPDGEACNADGTLKDASEMEWLNSPTDLAAPALPLSKNPQLADSGKRTKNQQVSLPLMPTDSDLLTVSKFTVFSNDSDIYATDDDGDKESIIVPPTSDVGEMSIDGAYSQGVDEEHGDGDLDDSDGEGDSDEEEGSSEEGEEMREGAKRFEAANTKADKVKHVILLILENCQLTRFIMI